jgi:hypothetical protein
MDRQSKSMNLNNIQELKDVAMQCPKWGALATTLCTPMALGNNSSNNNNRLSTSEVEEYMSA